MYLISPTTLLLALVLASPALYHAFVTGDLSVLGALVRFLIAVPVAVVMVALLRTLTAAYRNPKKGVPAALAGRTEAQRSEALHGEIEDSKK